MSQATTKPLHTAAEIEALPKPTFHHPYNPACEVSGIRLSELTGLSRVGLSLVRVPPGRESSCYHTHTTEEEFIYILSGHGETDIDEQTHAIGPGDFMGFPTPSVGHVMRNTGSEDLVYLVGGESKQLEVADFPRLGKRLIRNGSSVDVFDLSDRQDFPLKIE